MLVEVGLESEGFVALAAVMRLGGRMGLHVGAQIGTVSESLAAVGAAVGLLSRVRAHVTLQEPRPGKRLGADRANVREGVRQQVHRQRRHRDISLAAGRARSSATRLQAPVRLLVTRQVGRRRVGLAAFAADVAAGTRRRIRRRGRQFL